MSDENRPTKVRVLRYENGMKEEGDLEFEELTFDDKLRIYKSMGFACYELALVSKEFRRAIIECIPKYKLK